MRPSRPCPHAAQMELWSCRQQRQQWQQQQQCSHLNPGVQRRQALQAGVSAGGAGAVQGLDAVD